MNKLLSFVLFLFLFSFSRAQVSDFKTINFGKANNIANSHKGENLHDLSLLTYNLTNELTTDVEKFRAIYLWVCNNIESDYYYSLKIISKRKKYQNDSIKLIQWNETFKDITFKRLLNKKKTICTGYAYLIKQLANLSNIECEIINGFGITENLINSKTHFPNHSWNAVKLNNKWYLCDATWSAGLFDLETNTFDFKYNDGYFLTEPELFSKNHFPLDQSWFLFDTNLTVEGFYKAPLIYNNAFNEKVFPVAPETMKIETTINTAINFVLKKSENVSINSITLNTYSGNDFKIVTPKTELTNNELIRFNHFFEKKGIYDVHIVVNNKIICTYVVKVKT
jgi:transglutaminase/protease-like cytokinesis protein 3